MAMRGLRTFVSAVLAATLLAGCVHGPTGPRAERRHDRDYGQRDDALYCRGTINSDEYRKCRERQADDDWRRPEPTRPEKPRRDDPVLVRDDIQGKPS
jgi:hypothetical protein